MTLGFIGLVGSDGVPVNFNHTFPDWRTWGVDSFEPFIKGNHPKQEPKWSQTAQNHFYPYLNNKYPKGLEHLPVWQHCDTVSLLITSEWSSKVKFNWFGQWHWWFSIFRSSWGCSVKHLFAHVLWKVVPRWKSQRQISETWAKKTKSICLARHHYI